MAAPTIVTTAPSSSAKHSLNGTLDTPKPSIHPSNATASAPDLPTEHSDRHRLPWGENDISQITKPILSNPSAKNSRITFDEPEKVRNIHAPPAYGDDSNSSLALPVSRLSESSRSDASSGEHIYASTTTHTFSTTTTLFRLPRRKKPKGLLFPLPVKTTFSGSNLKNASTPQVQIRDQGLKGSLSAQPSSPVYGIGHNGITDTQNEGNPPPGASPGPSPSYGLDPSFGRNSTVSASSNSTSPVRAPTLPFGRRSQSKASARQSPEDTPLPTPSLPQSGRTSSSTGRVSLGGLFNVSRLRQNSDLQTGRANSSHPPLPGTPISAGSKSHSFTLNREPLAVPQRLDGDTPAKYLVRLEEAVSRSAIASVVSKSDDDFSKNVLRSYMRGFKFFGDPLDMAVRKLLMVAELPKETQQIDRVLESFANRYHECNPGVYASPDEAYFVAFSILILHTDVFNRNNKNKMQKHDYTKNASGQGVANDILDCFYDNILYTPFIRVEDDLDFSGERMANSKPRKNLFTKQSTDAAGRPSREPVDPYALILDNRLDSLRPSLRDVMNMEDHYNSEGPGNPRSYASLYQSFFKYGNLQILSSRSRPDAFMSPATLANPSEALPGVVDIKVTKVGILWRKDTKKKKTRSPWQEWGAILTGTQLYFFRNSGWIKSLMHQHDSHVKRSRNATVVFKPPLEHFKPDVLMSTDNAIALLDTTYKKHKNAFLFIRHGGLEEVFLADSDLELTDWLHKLNYASAFRTAGIRIRGWMESSTELKKQLGASGIDSERTIESSESFMADADDVGLPTDASLMRQIRAARQQMMAQKIAEAEEKLKELGNALEMQLRNARHLQLLAPIQNRTREQVILAAGGMSAKIKWTRIDIWRVKCHRNILVADMDDDIKSGGKVEFEPDLVPSPQRTASSVKADSVGVAEHQGSAGRSGSKSHTGDCKLSQAQVSSHDAESIDEMFSSFKPVAMGSIHKSKGSWELPPFSFQPGTPPSKNPSSRSNDSRMLPQTVSTARRASDLGDLEVRERHIASMSREPQDVEDHQEIPGNTHAVASESPKVPRLKLAEAASGDTDQEPARLKPQEPENTEGRTKARRSLQRTLREPRHASGHHRSRKGKDSASSIGPIDKDVPMNEVTGLARSKGSFTVHGKKASVVNLGSEWQELSPDDKLRQRRESHLDAPNVQEQQLGTSVEWRQRPTSSTSFSTNTTFTEAFEELGTDAISESDLKEEEVNCI